MARAKADPVVGGPAAVAMGAATGGVVLAGLDSDWALLGAVVFLGAVTLLAVYVGMISRP